jgi:hypothetical protein
VRVKYTLILFNSVNFIFARINTDIACVGRILLGAEIRLNFSLVYIYVRCLQLDVNRFDPARGNQVVSSDNRFSLKSKR